MSGQVTGWVLRHGPKDRAMRAVLITIADAANRDGENAHPGLNAMIEGSGYSRSTVLAAVARLERDGWIETTDRGGGRGQATVYKVITDITKIVQRLDPFGTERVQPLDPFASGNGPIHSEKGSDPAPETVRSGDSTPLTATVSNNGTTNGPSPSAPATVSPPVRRDLLFDAVLAAIGQDPAELTPSARGAVNHALAELRAVGADPGEVPARSAVYRARFPDATLTATALAKHWAACRPSSAVATSPPGFGPRRASSVGDDSLAAGARWLERQAARR